MQKVAWLAVLSGCVFHIPADGLGDGSDSDLYPFLESDQLPAGQASLAQIYASDGADLRQTTDLQADGDFVIREWTAHEDEIDVILDVSPDAEGTQIIDMTYGGELWYVSFDVDASAP